MCPACNQMISGGMQDTGLCRECSLRVRTQIIQYPPTHAPANIMAFLSEPGENGIRSFLRQRIQSYVGDRDDDSVGQYSHPIRNLPNELVDSISFDQPDRLVLRPDRAMGQLNRQFWEQVPQGLSASQTGTACRNRVGRYNTHDQKGRHHPGPENTERAKHWHRNQ